MAIQFVPFIPRPRQPHDNLLSNRNRIRAGLRVTFNGGLRELTGIKDAHVSYPVRKYARLVVLRYGHKFVGWPPGIPFRNLSKIPGGIRTLAVLQDAWDRGTLRFEVATKEDLEEAARSPVSVHPNPALISEEDMEEVGEEDDQDELRGNEGDQDELRDAADGGEGGEPVAAETGSTVLNPLVLHPGHLGVIGRHPIPMHAGAGSSTSVLGKRARRQRRDVKKPRHKPVKNPQNIPSRRNRRGVTSEPFVLDSEDDIPPESEIEDFSDDELPAQKRVKSSSGLYWVTNEPLDEFV
ncbi:hypothetical protein GY45DRAFT_1376488 [Cubamyces sp. BRFM 1775]|nr:hypothetical protein GY45DRAFT_1376488 [Cubamyces sp. BRFM 1775]